MAIKTESKIPEGIQEAHKALNPPNAMIFEIIRTGQVFYYQDGSVILLSMVSTNTLTAPHGKMRIGEVTGRYREQDEMPQMLAGDGDRYILETTSETVRVVTRFYI